MPGTSRYNLRPRRGGKEESRPSSEKRTHQRGPVRSGPEEEESNNTAPTLWSKEDHERQTGELLQDVSHL
ncbi:hypothetical protein TNCV_1009601 [Trichonephila clavipes]|nr:hypothetical protein TNCV_1009601 [Trichonephila clavipes]